MTEESFLLKFHKGVDIRLHDTKWEYREESSPPLPAPPTSPGPAPPSPAHRSNYIRYMLLLASKGRG